MKEYVCKEKLKTALLKYGFTSPDMTVTELVEDIPSTDVVEVVKCKDCKHLSTEEKEPHYYWCDELNFGVRPEEDYCSLGDRRKEQKSSE